jgi:hypothetical protein
MRNFLFILVAIFSLVACEKENIEPEINVEGYWEVQKDITFTSNATNATADQYHLFRGPNAFYRMSFLKTQDFSILTATPRSDLLIGFYKVEGKMLMTPTRAPSYTNPVEGCVLLSQKENEMLFTRHVTIRRDAVSGAIVSERTDTLRYIKVKDAVKVAYFDNYLKKYHP